MVQLKLILQTQSTCSEMIWNICKIMWNICKTIWNVCRLIWNLRCCIYNECSIIQIMLNTKLWNWLIFDAFFLFCYQWNLHLFQNQRQEFLLITHSKNHVLSAQITSITPKWPQALQFASVCLIFSFSVVVCHCVFALDDLSSLGPGQPLASWADVC